MINKKIIDTLKELDVTVAYQEIKQRKDKYIIFNIYNEKDILFCNDINLAEKCYITLNYWYTNATDLGLYKQVKKLMKENDFTFDNGTDLKKDGDYYGKSMDFKYEELL